MTTTKVRGRLLRCSLRGLLAICCVVSFGHAGAQTVSSRKARPETIATKIGSHVPLISALMLSDIHFDPFQDPEKVQQLVDAPVSDWERILSAPASANQEQAFASLQQACLEQGPDTSNALLQSSLHAIREQGARAKFITVSGDWIAHSFDCRFARVVPGKSPADYAAFVEKTISYVMAELRKSAPGVPVYAALGNNDSGCGDYRMDAHSDFLAATGAILLHNLPASEEKDKALADFSSGGYYSVTMAAPMRRTRLIVLNDIFMSRSYETCAGRRDPAEADAQVDWLRRELDEARRQKQRVWVMGHIPPGIDIYGTVKKMRDVCGGASPDMFLSSDKMANVLTGDADLIRLGIFAHTHMDELRLLGAEGAGTQAPHEKMIAVKMVSSVSPVHGNRPSFTVARVDPASATLVDYEVFDASNLSGIGATWSKEYTYSQTYHEAAFAPLELENLLTGFREDPEAKTKASQAFIRYFFAGDDSSLIKPLWPEYVCELSTVTAQGFHSCLCGSQH